MAAHPPWEASGVAPGPLAAVPLDGTVMFQVPGYLHFVKALGSGTYGQVAAFRDTRTGTEVAIKRIPNAFKSGVDAKRCLRELKLLRALEHESIVGLLDIIPPLDPDFQEVYFVTELLDADMHTVIQSEQTLAEEHIQFFVYNILSAVQYMHASNVVHRDIKPGNILVNKNCDIRICDFGLARGRMGFSQEEDDFLRTEYIGTRWYRAPEVVLTSMEYTAAVDIWSVGCILGELIGRVPMFCGNDFLHQIKAICQILGTPSDEDLSFIPQESDEARKFIQNRCPSFPKKDWAELYPSASEAAHDLLDKMVRFNPTSRITAKEALLHEYLEEYRDDEEEPVATVQLDWAFDDVPVGDAGQLKCMIYREAAALHPEILERDKDELERRGWHSARA